MGNKGGRVCNSEAKNVYLSRANTDPVNPYGDVSFACGRGRRDR